MDAPPLTYLPHVGTMATRIPRSVARSMHQSTFAKYFGFGFVGSRSTSGSSPYLFGAVTLRHGISGASALDASKSKSHAFEFRDGDGHDHVESLGFAVVEVVDDFGPVEAVEELPCRVSLPEEGFILGIYDEGVSGVEGEMAPAGRRLCCVALRDRGGGHKRARYGGGRENPVRERALEHRKASRMQG